MKLSKEKKKLYRQRLLLAAEKLHTDEIGSCTAISGKPLFFSSQSFVVDHYPFYDLRRSYADFFGFSDAVYAEAPDCSLLLVRELCLLLYREVIND